MHRTIIDLLLCHSLCRVFVNLVYLFSAEIDVCGLRKQQMELLTLCAVRGLLTTRTKLRKVLMQPPDNTSTYLESLNIVLAHMLELVFYS